MVENETPSHYTLKRSVNIEELYISENLNLWKNNKPPTIVGIIDKMNDYSIKKTRDNIIQLHNISGYDIIENLRITSDVPLKYIQINYCKIKPSLKGQTNKSCLGDSTNEFYLLYKGTIPQNAMSGIIEVVCEKKPGYIHVSYIGYQSKIISCLLQQLNIEFYCHFGKDKFKVTNGSVDFKIKLDR